MKSGGKNRKRNLEVVEYLPALSYSWTILIMKYFLITSLLFIVSVPSQAQTTTDSVEAAINLLFDAMKQSDGIKLASAFADSAVLQTISQTKDGKLFIRNESVKEFAASISKLPKGAADERIVFETIKIDGPLASVWTPYKFFYNGQFSHCGVDSYQLVRINGVWKIQYLIDTRRKSGCTVD